MSVHTSFILARSVLKCHLCVSEHVFVLTKAFNRGVRESQHFAHIIAIANIKVRLQIFFLIGKLVYFNSTYKFYSIGSFLQ